MNEEKSAVKDPGDPVTGKAVDLNHMVEAGVEDLDKSGIGDKSCPDPMDMQAALPADQGRKHG